MSRKKGSSRDADEPPAVVPGSPIGSVKTRPRFSYYDPVRFDVDDGTAESFIISPKVSMRTDEPPARSLRRTLEHLAKADFRWVHHFRGPDLGLDVTYEGMADVEDVLEALRKVGETDPPLGGFRAVMVHDQDKGLVAKAQVSGKGPVRVRIKVRGRMHRAPWKNLCKRLASKLRADL